MMAYVGGFGGNFLSFLSCFQEDVDGFRVSILGIFRLIDFSFADCDDSAGNDSVELLKVIPFCMSS